MYWKGLKPTVKTERRLINKPDLNKKLGVLNLEIGVTLLLEYLEREL